ncbi:hypothetical protein D3C87_472780 [compost metagenome]
MGVGRIQQVAGGGVQHALGLAGGAGGVQDEQRVFGVHPLRLALRRLCVHHVVEPAVARGLHVHRTAGVAHHQHRLHRGGTGQLQGRIHVGLERDSAATAQAFVGGDDQLAAAVDHPVGDRVRRKATKHHRVHRADARAGEHGHGGIDDHRQVDGDPVALLHAEVAQRIAQTAHALMQLAIGDALRRRVRAVRFKQQRDLVAPLLELAVQAVDAGIELAVLEPLDAEIVEVVADVLDRGGLLEPLQALRGLAPEGIRVLHRLAVERFVRVLVNARLGGEIRLDGVKIGHGTLTCTRTWVVRSQHNPRPFPLSLPHPPPGALPGWLDLGRTRWHATVGSAGGCIEKRGHPPREAGAGLSAGGHGGGGETRTDQRSVPTQVPAAPAVRRWRPGRARPPGAYD